MRMKMNAATKWCKIPFSFRRNLVHFTSGRFIFLLSHLSPIFFAFWCLCVFWCCCCCSISSKDIIEKMANHSYYSVSYDQYLRGYNFSISYLVPGYICSIYRYNPISIKQRSLYIFDWYNFCVCWYVHIYLIPNKNIVHAATRFDHIENGTRMIVNVYYIGVDVDAETLIYEPIIFI